MCSMFAAVSLGFGMLSFLRIEVSPATSKRRTHDRMLHDLDGERNENA